MITRSILVCAMLATGAIASPALAQSREHTGSMFPNYYTPTCQQVWGAWGPSLTAVTTARLPYLGFISGGQNIYSAVSKAANDPG
jgi:hypothetical protein